MNMSILQEFDDLSVCISGAVELVQAVWECIDHGANAPEEYADALFSAYGYLHNLAKELRTCVDDVYRKRGYAE